MSSEHFNVDGTPVDAVEQDLEAAPAQGRAVAGDARLDEELVFVDQIQPVQFGARSARLIEGSGTCRASGIKSAPPITAQVFAELATDAELARVVMDAGPGASRAEEAELCPRFGRRVRLYGRSRLRDGSAVDDRAGSSQSQLAPTRDRGSPHRARSEWFPRGGPYYYHHRPWDMLDDAERQRRSGL